MWDHAPIIVHLLSATGGRPVTAREQILELRTATTVPTAISGT
ncbi:hypothetical protein [Streptomyces sp. NPDC054786]